MTIADRDGDLVERALNHPQGLPGYAGGLIIRGWRGSGGTPLELFPSLYYCFRNLVGFELLLFSWSSEGNLVVELNAHLEVWLNWMEPQQVGFEDTVTTTHWAP